MIETGHIIVVHHYFNLFDYRTWLSALIRKKTKCDWNHIEIIQNVEGEIEVVGGLSKGFVGRHWKYWLHERPMYYEIWKPKNFTDKQLSKLIRYKGKKYDYWSTFFWHGLHWLTGKWYGSKGIGATEKGNCSEIIADIFGIENAHMATTADILNSGIFEKWKSC